MWLAINDRGEKIQPFPGGRATCPGCGAAVLAKCGDVNMDHWAHESLDECDTKAYEPKTFWHCQWQERFAPEDREVIIAKDNKFHIADIVGKEGLVIEVQHSPLSVADIKAREASYGKMVWILNARAFAHQLHIIGVSVDTTMHGYNPYLTYHQNTHLQLERIQLDVPTDDDFTIQKSIESHAALCEQDEYTESTWYMKPNKSGTIGDLPSDLRGAYHGHLLGEKLAEKIHDINASYTVDIVWHQPRRSWLHATCPVFLDIAPRFMIWLTKHN